MSTLARQSLSLAILNLYFDEVVLLKKYLHEILEPHSLDTSNPEMHSTLAEDIADSCSNLLKTSYVGLKSDGSQRPSFRVMPPMMYMREIIQKAHERLFSESRRPNNIIAAGYQRASSNERNHTSCSGISNRFVNTIVTALHGPEWETMLQRIGADAMLHLLLNTSLFISLPNDCFCQITGDPLIYIPPPGGGFLEIGPHSSAQKRKRETSLQQQPRKRLKLIGSTANYGGKPVKLSRKRVPNQPIERRTAADINFIQARLSYARPSRDPDAFRIIVGLPHDHVLNRLRPSYKKTPVDPNTYKDADPRALARDARHLSKYIFPSEYGLSSVFILTANWKGAYTQPNYCDREQEIKVLGSCKTPKRLKDTLTFVEKMIWRHGKCGYKPLRDKVCPSKVVNTNKQTMDSSIILEMVSEQSLQLRSQPTEYNGNMSIDSSGNSIVALGVSEAKKYGMYKPRFIEFTCSYIEVLRYVMLVTKIVIPKQFWGSQKNFKLVQSYVKEFIVARRFETLSLHHVLQGFSTTDCDWLVLPGGPGYHHGRVSVTDSLKRRELLEEFMFWYFDSFVTPLIKTTFYVTDSSAFRNQILYFRQDDWEILCAPLLDQLSEKTFREIEKQEAEEILRQRRLGFSFVRLLPKETGVRPIVNLKRRMVRHKSLNLSGIQSINEILQATFRILTYEKQRQPDILGASVFGPNDIYSRLKAYKTKLMEDHPSGVLPKLYFVKVDVQACFDTIEQSTLLRILKELLSEENYLIQRYGRMTPVAGKIRRAYVKKAHPEDEHPDFVAYARNMANAFRDTVFIDQVNYNFESRQTAMQLLEEHINENIVKIGQKYYRQVVGIPQGSVLSALLCAYCYGDLEKTKLDGFFSSKNPENLLLRLMDDYIFVTTCPQKAKFFLETMISGFPEYGCKISQEKTLTNFDYGVQIMNVVPPGQKFFPWCGLLIDMTDLSILADYTRFNGTHLQGSLTVHKGHNPGVNFVCKMLRLAKSRGHIIYNDTDLNGIHTVYLSIYRNFLITAAKMHYYLESWGVDLSKNVKFLHNTIRQVIRYTHAVIVQSSRSNVSRANAGKCNVHKADVIWLGTHAFHAVLSRKTELYGSLVMRPLAFELTLPKNTRIRRRFRKLVKEGSPLLVSMGL